VPELPEVEVICRGLAPHIIGRRVKKISSSMKRLRLPVQREKLVDLLEGRDITGLLRRAKFMLVVFNNNAILIIHLGMTGRLGLFHCQTPKAKHDHLRILFDDDSELRFNDARRFGSVQVIPPDAYKSIEDLFPYTGPEPLGRKFTAAYLLKQAANRRQPVKNFLMDSRIVAGIGNIYANEILFATGIHPQTEAGCLDGGSWKNIVRTSRRILNRAIDCGGTTISDYVNASGGKGYFQIELKIYGRHGQTCTRCRTIIAKKVLAGRSSFFCPNCQKIQSDNVRGEE